MFHVEATGLTELQRSYNDWLLRPDGKELALTENSSQERKKKHTSLRNQPFYLPTAMTSTLFITRTAAEHKTPNVLDGTANFLSSNRVAGETKMTVVMLG